MMLQKSGLKFSLKGYLQLGYRSIANHGIMYLSHGTNNYGCFELYISYLEICLCSFVFVKHFNLKIFFNSIYPIGRSLWETFS